MNAPPLLHDRYRITTKLGESRLAQVYRAHDERLQRPVLVHLLRQELIATLRERFIEEAQRGAQRSHPGLIEVYDTGEVGGRPYMITEDVQGQPLCERIPLKPAQAVAILRTIVGAVALAQAQGAPHPPISSRNVWVIPGGRALLLENWELGPREAALDLAHYRAPERGRGGAPSPATSTYALGILAWETLVGRHPFNGDTPEALAAAQQHDALPPLKAVLEGLYSPGLDRIVEQAAASDPGMRYPTPTDFGRALDLYVDGMTAQTSRLQAAVAAAQPQLAAREPGQVRPGRETQMLRRQPPPDLEPTIAPPRTRTSALSTLPFRRERRAVPPPPAARSVAPPPQQQVGAPLDQVSVEKAVEQAMRKQGRRQGCQQALWRLTWRLATIALIVLAILLGGGYAYSAIRSYVTGQVQRFNPGDFVRRQVPALPSLPSISPSDWLRRLLPDSVPELPDTPDIPLVTSYEVRGPLNLRDGPTINARVIRQLQPGVVVRALGEQQQDDQGREWIKVLTTDGIPEQGWVANLPDSLQKQ